MSMDLFSIASGSSGNCICVGNNHYHVMIDAGISGKRIEQGMNAYDYTTADMDAILVTHEHIDHIQGLGVISRKYHLPIYATKGTIEQIKRKHGDGIDAALYHEITPEVDFTIGDLLIHPMHVSHDAADPVAYKVISGDQQVAVLTDLGIYDDHIVDQVRGLDAIMLESNYDLRMLETGRYTYPLKQRIWGDHGHLSNVNCGQLLSEILHDDMQHILLGHLSKENNMPEIAYETVRCEINAAECPYKGSDFLIEVAPRDHISSRVVV